MDEASLREKLQRIEALFEGAASEGERAAAANARDRVRARLEAMTQESPPVEWKFALGDIWSRRLFLALLRRYGLEPYRYRGQRITTVRVKAPKPFVENTLWPQFVELDKTLHGYLHEVTERVVAQVIHQDASEAAEISAPKLLGPAESDDT